MKQMFFWKSLAFSMIQWILALWSLVPLPFLNPAWTSIWKFTVRVLLMPDLENFEYHFASMWDECNRAVVWTFFGIVLLCDWNENWPFPVLWPLMSFLSILSIWLRIVRCLALGEWSHHHGYLDHEDLFLYSSSVYSCHLFLISSASVRSIIFLSFIVTHFCMKYSLGISNFLTV